jgi:CRP-like cAMP-binding protein
MAATDYEIVFFASDRWWADEALNGFYDAAHRHLEALNALIAPAEQGAGAAEANMEQRLIEGLNIFGLLLRPARGSISSPRTVARDVVLEQGKIPEAITTIAYGILAASTRIDEVAIEIMRFKPREYLGESGLIAGLPINATVTAKTHAIGFDLPGAAVSILLKKHSDIAHALAARLAIREREGRALMQPATEPPPTQHGLASGSPITFDRCTARAADFCSES